MNEISLKIKTALNVRLSVFWFTLSHLADGGNALEHLYSIYYSFYFSFTSSTNLFGVLTATLLRKAIVPTEQEYDIDKIIYDLALVIFIVGVTFNKLCTKSTKTLNTIRHQDL